MTKRSKHVKPNEHGVHVVDLDGLLNEPDVREAIRRTSEVVSKLNTEKEVEA